MIGESGDRIYFATFLPFVVAFLAASNPLTLLETTEPQIYLKEGRQTNISKRWIATLQSHYHQHELTALLLECSNLGRLWQTPSGFLPIRWQRNCDIHIPEPWASICTLYCRRIFYGIVIVPIRVQSGQDNERKNEIPKRVEQSIQNFSSQHVRTHCKPKDARGNFDPSDKVAMGLMVSTAACALGITRPPTVVVPPSAAAAMLAWWIAVRRSTELPLKERTSLVEATSSTERRADLMEAIVTLFARWMSIQVYCCKKESFFFL